MQTILTLPQESTEHSHKKIIFVSAFITIAVFVCYFFINRNDYHPKIYDNVEKVLALFEDNYEDFEMFMNVIYHHHAFSELLEERSESKTSDYKDLKKYMSEEEYKIVEHFWLTYRPYYMGSGWIDFRVDQEVFSIQLFSCRGLTESQKDSYLTYCLQDADLKQLRSEGEWYCLIPNHEKTKKREQITHENTLLLEFVFSDFDDSLKKARRLAEILTFDANGKAIKKAEIENENNFSIEVSVYDDSETKYYVFINRENGQVEEVRLGDTDGQIVYGCK